MPTDTISTHDRWRLRRLDRLSGGIPADEQQLWCGISVGSDATTSPFPAEIEALESPPTAAEAIAAFLEGRWSHVVLLAEGLRLEPEAMRIARAYMARLEGDVYYGDDDHLGEDGGHHSPSFKPGWSPELLLGRDYIGGFAIVGRRAAKYALLTGAPLDSLYDLYVSFVDSPMTVTAIPEILFNRTTSVTTTLTVEAAAPAIVSAGGRRGFDVRLHDAGEPGSRRLEWALKDPPLVSVVIASTLRNGHVERCLASIAERTSYPDYQIIVAANAGGELPAVLPELRLPGRDSSIVRIDEPFSYARINNLGAEAATGEFLVFLNDDTTIETGDWLEQLVQLAQLPTVGVVGATLFGTDGTLQVAGVLLIDDPHCARVLGHGQPPDDPGYLGLFTVTRETSSAAGACMCLATEHFRELGGWDETIAIELGDVDLCLRSQAEDRRTLITPHARIRHSERASRGATIHPEDHMRFRVRWEHRLHTGDPYYSPHHSTTFDREWGLADWEPRDLSVLYGLEAGAEQRESEERFVPETMGGSVQAEHLARYGWVRQLIPGRRVLDAACGVGYGSALLAANGAASVTGIDISADAIQAAAPRAAANLTFAVADLRELPFADGAFDVVVCFEAIEHVLEWDVALAELARVLTAGGILVVSSPNRGVYPPGNPYHVSEFTPGELRIALERYFANVALRRQHPWWASLICDDELLSSRTIRQSFDAAVAKLSGSEPGDEMYSLGIASNGPLPALRDHLVLTDLLVASGHLHRIAALEAELAERCDDIVWMRESLSWRVTRPLRGAKALLRRAR